MREDYDAALRELEPEAFEFRIGGRDFVAPTDADARQMLDFLRKAASTNSREVADGMRALLGEEVWDYIYAKPQTIKHNGGIHKVERDKIAWSLVRALVNDLAVYYGGGIVGAPKAVVDPQLMMNPPTEAETSSSGSEDESGSSIIGDLLSGEGLNSTEEE